MAEGFPVRSGERVQKIIARSGAASRRGAEDMIRAGRVTINGRIAELGDRADPAVDYVKLDGRPVARPVQRRYILLNKPVGVLTTVADPEDRETVIDLLPRRLQKGLFPVGRLDHDSEGLILLTTDGDFAHKVAHPRHGCIKTYEVKVRGVPEVDVLVRLEEGLRHRGRRFRPCRVKPHRVKGARRQHANSWWLVQLQEGRNRQIRDMFQAVGHPVQRLRRVGIGSLRDPRLRPGTFRALEPGEIEALVEAERRGLPPRTARPPAGRRARKSSRAPASKKKKGAAGGEKSAGRLKKGRPEKVGKKTVGKRVSGGKGIGKRQASKKTRRSGSRRSDSNRSPRRKS